MLFCKNAVIAFSLPMLFGCGFQPIFGTGVNPEISSEIRYIEISPISDQIGQQLRNHLVHNITPMVSQLLSNLIRNRTNFYIPYFATDFRIHPCSKDWLEPTPKKHWKTKSYYGIFTKQHLISY
jgi:hypothetical protein